jgi:hypothetical protein
VYKSASGILYHISRAKVLKNYYVAIFSFVYCLLQFFVLFSFFFNAIRSSELTIKPLLSSYGMKADRIPLSEFISSAHNEGFCVTLPSDEFGNVAAEGACAQQLVSFDNIELYRISLDPDL